MDVAANLIVTPAADVGSDPTAIDSLSLRSVGKPRPGAVMIVVPESTNDPRIEGVYVTVGEAVASATRGYEWAVELAFHPSPLQPTRLEVTDRINREGLVSIGFGRGRAEPIGHPATIAVIWEMLGW